MRKQTLAGAAVLLSFAIVVALRYAALRAGVRIPVVSDLSPFFVSFLATPLVLFPLRLLNRRLLAWRKARGRDIEEEEKYENVEAGIISLRPVEREDENRPAGAARRSPRP